MVESGRWSKPRITPEGVVHEGKKDTVRQRGSGPLPMFRFSEVSDCEASGKEVSAESRSALLEIHSENTRRRLTRLEVSLGQLDLLLDLLADSWFDALEEWQAAIRNGGEEESPEWRHLMKIENELERRIFDQKVLTEAMLAAMANLKRI